MAEVRAKTGVPLVSDFGGLGAPTVCAPLVVDSTTGLIYSLTAAGLVKSVPLSGISATIVTAKLTALGADGSMTFVNGVLTEQIAAT